MQLQQERHTLTDNVFPKTVLKLLATYHWCNHRLKENLIPYAITVQQYHVLRILEDKNPQPSTVNMIKSDMLDKMSDASRIIDRLTQKGLVRKINSRADKRATEITLTTEGSQLLAKIDQRETLAQLISTTLSIEEAKTLNLLLDKLRTISAPL